MFLKWYNGRERAGVILYSGIQRDSPRAIGSNVIFNSELLCVPQRALTVCELRWKHSLNG